VFAARYEMNSYIVFRKRLVSKTLMRIGFLAGIRRLRCVLRKWDVMDWIHLAEDRDQSRALVSTVTNIQVPRNIGKFLSS
jgi:hypothetical protein